MLILIRNTNYNSHTEIIIFFRNYLRYTDILNKNDYRWVVLQITKTIFFSLDFGRHLVLKEMKSNNDRKVIEHGIGCMAVSYF